ncbi:MAG: VOC family protein [Acetobacteraceae bacterium]|nr:VOC family protein [Acetobacteraceae bacterium]
MSLGAAPLARIDLPCRDIGRQREFYARVLGLAVEEGVYAAFRCGGVRLVLRPRGDALFPSGAAASGAALLAFAVPDDELERWHRRMMMARVAVLEAPGANGAAPRLLRVSDAEGNVVELFAARP